jgi:hypothetical protein
VAIKFEVLIPGAVTAVSDWMSLVLEMISDAMIRPMVEVLFTKSESVVTPPAVRPAVVVETDFTVVAVKFVVLIAGANTAVND